MSHTVCTSEFDGSVLGMLRRTVDADDAAQSLLLDAARSVINDVDSAEDEGFFQFLEDRITVPEQDRERLARALSRLAALQLQAISPGADLERIERQQAVLTATLSSMEARYGLLLSDLSRQVIGLAFARLEDFINMALDTIFVDGFDSSIPVLFPDEHPDGDVAQTDEDDDDSFVDADE